jgi:hypothetical protein
MSHLRLCAIIGTGLLVLAGCSNGTPSLMNAQARSDSPDEFSIVPTQPLQAPDDYNSLPTPTPGGGNLVDPDPRAQAVAALGGRISAERTSGIPAADAGLVRYAARQGVSEDIRQTLATEDEAFRRRNSPRILERMFNSNVYRQAYDEQILDPQEELARWRARGVRTPAAPPPAQ